MVIYGDEAMRKCYLHTDILRASGRFRFSISDRSGEDFGDAGGNGRVPVVVAGTVGTRTLANQFGEPRAERSERRTPNRKADFRDGQVAAA